MQGLKARREPRSYPSAGVSRGARGQLRCHVGRPRGDRLLGLECPRGSRCQRAAYLVSKPGSSLGLCGEGSARPRQHRCPRGGAEALAGGREGRALQGSAARGPRGGSREVVLGSSSALRFPLPARRLLAAAPPPSPFSLPLRGWARSAASARLAPARASSRSLSPFPSSLRGARSRGAPGKMAAAGDGGGEGGAAAPGPGPRGPSPFSEARDDARSPVPAALHPEEVASRLQRMRRELSNRRKILVKNLPQDSSCQVRGRAARRRVPGGSGAAAAEQSCPLGVQASARRLRAVRGRRGRAELRALSVAFAEPPGF